jgi:hypothetical protein
MSQRTLFVLGGCTALDLVAERFTPAASGRAAVIARMSAM